MMTARNAWRSRRLHAAPWRYSAQGAGEYGDYTASDPHPPGGRSAYGKGNFLRRPKAGKRDRESPGTPSEKPPFRGASAVADSGRMPGMRFRVPEAGPSQGAEPMSRLQRRSDFRPIVPRGRRGIRVTEYEIPSPLRWSPAFV